MIKQNDKKPLTEEYLRKLIRNMIIKEEIGHTEFFTKVDEVKEKLESMNKYVDEISELHDSLVQNWRKLNGENIVEIFKNLEKVESKKDEIVGILKDTKQLLVGGKKKEEKKSQKPAENKSKR